LKGTFSKAKTDAYGIMGAGTKLGMSIFDVKNVGLLLTLRKQVSKKPHQAMAMSSNKVGRSSVLTAA
jgi:hypothetical protein